MHWIKFDWLFFFFMCLILCCALYMEKKFENRPDNDSGPYNLECLVVFGKYSTHTHTHAEKHFGLTELCDVGWLESPCVAVNAPWRGLCPAAGGQEGSRPWWRCCPPSPPLYLPPSPGTSAAGPAVFPPSCRQSRRPPPSYGTATASQRDDEAMRVNSDLTKLKTAVLQQHEDNR